jgi:hypothetical protein
VSNHRPANCLLVEVEDARHVVKDAEVIHVQAVGLA